MEHFTNKAESFFREIRSIEIYNATDVSYESNFKGIFPVNNLALYKFDIVPENFSRNIKPKKMLSSYYFDIEISFPVLDLSKATTDKIFTDFNKKSFSIVAVSNTEKLLLGNDREPLLIEAIPGVKDDNSGTDENTIVISGETIITPKTENL